MIRCGTSSNSIELEVVHDPQEIAELDRQGLREFGLVTGALIAGIFGLGLPWVFDFTFPYWPWIVGGLLAAWAIVRPTGLKLVYRYWMRLALLLNRITTPIILWLVFFLIITPVGLVMRLAGRDAMARKFDAKAASYRIESHKRAKQQMERPF